MNKYSETHPTTAESCSYSVETGREQRNEDPAVTHWPVRFAKSSDCKPQSVTHWRILQIKRGTHIVTYDFACFKNQVVEKKYQTFVLTRTSYANDSTDTFPWKFRSFSSCAKADISQKPVTHVW